MNERVAVMTPGRRALTHAVILFICGTGLYVESVSHDFHYDDFHSLVENPHIRSLANPGRFLLDPTQFSTHSQNAMYRPILLASYAVNYAFDGLHSRGYHLVNVLLHGVNGILVYGLVLALSRSALLAFLAACIFAIHPINSEPVNYVSSRSELLMAGFFLASCLAYNRFRESGRVDKRLLWYGLSIVAAAGALLSKSVAIVIAGAWALSDRLKFGRGWRSRLPYYLPVVVVGAVYLIFTRTMVGKALLTPVRPLDLQVLTQVKAWVYYLLLVIMPVKQSVEHQFFPAVGWLQAAPLWAGLFLVSVAWVAIRSRDHVLDWVGAWWVLVLAPTALVPLIVLVNEHRLYLAVPAFCAVTGFALSQLGGRSRVAPFLTVAYFLALAVLTMQRTQVWESELSLWQDAAAKGPLMVKPHLRYGDALVLAAEKAAEAEDRRELVASAEAAYVKAVELRPRHPGARNNLGLLLLNEGRLAAAEIQFRTLLEASPDIAPARLNLGRLLLQQDRWQEAETEYQAALQYGDTGGIAQGFLAHIAYAYRSDAERALNYYRQALALAVVPQAHYLVGQGAALAALNRFDEAKVAYRGALKEEPNTWRPGLTSAICIVGSTMNRGPLRPMGGW